jgi:hypothetical protein
VNQIVKGGGLIDVMEMSIPLEDCLPVGIEIGGHRKYGVDLLPSDIISQATTPPLKYDIDAAIILDEVR